MDIYETLLQEVGSLRNAEEAETSGLDDFLLPNKMKVASLGDLSDFFRISNDNLVHKAEKDLWKIIEGEDGKVIIERLFNPDTNKPIKV